MPPDLFYMHVGSYMPSCMHVTVGLDSTTVQLVRLKPGGQLQPILRTSDFLHGCVQMAKGELQVPGSESSYADKFQFCTLCIANSLE